MTKPYCLAALCEFLHIVFSNTRYIIFDSNSSMRLHRKKLTTTQNSLFFFISRFQFIYMCTWIKKRAWKNEKTKKLWRKESHDMTVDVCNFLFKNSSILTHFIHRLSVYTHLNVYNRLFIHTVHTHMYSRLCSMWTKIITSYEILNTFKTTNRLINNYITHCKWCVWAVCVCVYIYTLGVGFWRCFNHSINMAPIRLCTGMNKL